MKIVSVCVCILLMLSSTTLALTSFRTDEQQTKNQLVEKIPVPLPTSGGWMKTFGGIYYDQGESVEQTSDGGYIIAAETYGENRGDIWVIKTDGDGNKVWDRTFGGSGWDYRPFVKQTNDNGYIITARTYSFGVGNYSNIWVLKLDEAGKEQWNTTFGKEFSDYGSEIQQTTDGGYIIVGSVNLYELNHWDVGLIKIDNLGHEQWNRTFGESEQSEHQDFGESVRQTSDSGYIVTGATSSYGHTDGYAFWLIKTDAQGNEQWNRTYEGTEAAWGGGNSVDITSDGGYFLLGARWYYESNQSDIWVIKTNQYGDEQWNKTFGGIQDEYGSQAYQTNDEGYIILGNRVDWVTNDADALMIKLDASGEEQWNRTYGGKEWDAGNSVDLTSDGGYIITGNTFSYSKDDGASDVWLIKTDSQGKAKTTSLDNLWFKWLFQRFPHAFPLLRHLWNGKV
jgi:hypothetical protein